MLTPPRDSVDTPKFKMLENTLRCYAFAFQTHVFSAGVDEVWRCPYCSYSAVRPVVRRRDRFTNRFYS